MLVGSLLLRAGWQPSAPPVTQRAIVTTCTATNIRLSWQTGSFFPNDSSTTFEGGNHETMRDDAYRTPLYRAAIRERMQQSPTNSLAVLDLGTGPFALFAIEAANAGARVVYAIEADHTSAEAARAAVAAAGVESTVQVIEGVSTEVNLPEKVDVLISETVGSIASQEGLYSMMADAHARHVERPADAASWIPHRIETWGAPCTYALHRCIGHPALPWLDAEAGSLYRVAGFCCPELDDATLRLLASPQRFESVRLTHPGDLLGEGSHELTGARSEGTSDQGSSAACGPSFTLDSERMRGNEGEYREALTREGADPSDAEAFSAIVASEVSGIALWPRIILNDPHDNADGARLVVDARGPDDGEPRPSSWAAMLPLVGSQPARVTAGDEMAARLYIELESSVQSPPRYSMELSFKPATHSDEHARVEPDVDSSMLYRLSGPLGRVKHLSEKGGWGRAVLPEGAPHWSLQIDQLATRTATPSWDEVEDFDMDFMDEME